MDLQRDNERMRDALDHIQRCCHGSRTQTRRLRFMALRAKCALERSDDWKIAEIPVYDPLVETLRGAIEKVYPIASGWLADTLESYCAPVHQSEAPTLEQLIASIEEADVREECRTLVAFLAEAKRSVPNLWNRKRDEKPVVPRE